MRRAYSVFLSMIFCYSCSISKPSNTDKITGYMKDTDLALTQEAEFKNHSLYPCVEKNITNTSATDLSQDILINSVNWFFTCAGQQSSENNLALSRVLIVQAMKSVIKENISADDQKTWLGATSSAISSKLSNAEKFKFVDQVITKTATLGLQADQLNPFLYGTTLALLSKETTAPFTNLIKLSSATISSLKTNHAGLKIPSTNSISSLISNVFTSMFQAIHTSLKQANIGDATSALMQGGFSVNFASDTSTILQESLASCLVAISKLYDSASLTTIIDGLITGLCSGLQSVNSSCNNFKSNLLAAITSAESQAGNIFSDVNFCPDNSGIAKDKDGNCIFTTATTDTSTDTADTTAPTISGLIPSSSALRAPPATVKATFSEAVSALSASSFIITGTCNTKPTISSVEMSSDNISATATLTGGACTDGQTVSVSLSPSSISDLEGNTGSGNVALATYTIVLNGPLVTLGSPSSSALNSSGTATLALTISPSTAGDSTLSGSLTASGGGININTKSGSPTCHASVASITSSGAVVSLYNCTGSGTVAVQVQAGIAADSLGNTNPISGESTTITIDNTAPTLSTLTPTDATVTTMPSSIVATFSEAVDTLTTSKFVVSGSCSSTPTVSDVVMSSGNTVATATLSGGTCTNGQTLNVSMDPSQVSDYANNPGSGSTVTRTYILDTAGPSISSSSPSANAYIFAIPSTIVLNFSEAATATDANFDLTSSTCNSIPSIASISGSGTSTITINLSGGSCTGKSIVLTTNLSAITDSLGNHGTGTATTTLYMAKRIFLTSGTHNGNFSNIAGADSFCSSDSNKPASGTYKALIVDGSTRVACTSSFCTGSGNSEHVDWVIAANTYYARPDGTAIGSSSSVGLLNLPLSNGIGTLPFSSGKVWTGFDYDTRNWIYRSGATCSGWASTSGNGCYGANADTDDNFMDYFQSACSATLHLYCVEQ